MLYSLVIRTIPWVIFNPAFNIIFGTVALPISISEQISKNISSKLCTILVTSRISKNLLKLIGCWQYLGAVCFWQSIHFWLNLVVVAVLRDSLCVVSLLPCVADCCMLYNIVCKVERLVLTN